MERIEAAYRNLAASLEPAINPAAIAGTPTSTVKILPDREFEQVSFNPRPARNSIAGIGAIRNSLIAAANNEAARIIERANSEARLIKLQAMESAAKIAEQEQAIGLIRLTALRNGFIKQGAEQILNLIENTAALVLGEVVAPARGDHRAELIAEGFLRRRIARVMKDRLPGEPIRLELNPDDLRMLNLTEDLPNEASEKKTEEKKAFRPPLDAISSNPKLARGDGRIITEFGSINLRLSEHLEVVMAEIRSCHQISDALAEFLESEDA